MIQKEASGRSADESLFARHVRVRAHFGTRDMAERAASAVAYHARTVYVSHASPFRPARPAQDEDVAPVNLFQPHWLAFGAGLAIGTAALQLIFPDLLASTYVGPATAGTLVKAAFVITGLAVAIGWLTGALGRFWRRMPRPAGYELQAEVVGLTLDEAEQALRETGAVVVWVLGDESLPVAEPAN
jgi:hypothetical protein